MNSTSNNLIKMRKAAEMIESHDNFRKNFKDDAFIPVQSIQFTMEAIESYLDYVRSLSRLKGVEVSGIRIVNAIYPSDHEEQEKCNQQTVLFIPTYRNNGEDVAFDPLYVENGIPVDINRLLHDSGQGSRNYDQGSQKPQTIMFNIQGGEESSFMNFGSMGRPPIGDDD